MRWNILIGGQAGQGINKISSIVSEAFVDMGYFIFNYRDYPSLIRGGHNFNVLSVSDEEVHSHESKLDVIVALDDKTKEIHKKNLKKGGVVLDARGCSEKRDLNIALAGALAKVFGVDFGVLADVIRRAFSDEEKVDIARKSFDKQDNKFNLKKINRKIEILSGSEGVANGARLSGLNLYVAYPMTPATNVMHELAKWEGEDLTVFQPENEIAVVNMGIGASFAGAKVMIGTSGGGFDLMSEGLSLQGMSEVPLTVYLASRPGPATGVPTYTAQSDLDIALRAGHGEFPRIVVAPGNAFEAVEKTSEALFLAEKFGVLSVILSDKHVAESQFSHVAKKPKIRGISVKRDLPGQNIVRVSSYEHLDNGVTTEDAEVTRKNAERRIKKYEKMKEFIKKNCEMIKFHGNLKSKNLVIGWGSTSGAIIDAIKGMDAKFLQVVYLKPLSDEIRKEILSAKKVVLVENNVTGQLGRLIREKTGIKIENRILKYDARPFCSDELRESLMNVLS